MKRYKLIEAQNIIDLAIQEYGSIEGVFKLIDNNVNVENLDKIFSFQEEVLINEDEILNPNIKKYFSDRSKLFITTSSGNIETLKGSLNNDFNNDFYNL